MYIFLYFGILKSDPIFLLRNNLKIKLRMNSTDIQAFTNVWILEEYNICRMDIQENDVVIDIGAHIGLFTIYISQFCTKGRIFCFEPIKENYELLSYNINLNKIENVRIFSKAVTDKSDTIRIFLSSDAAAHSLFIKGTKYVEVESTTLREILDSNKIEVCNLLKLDCEGSEYIILNSLPNFYFERIQKIVMEYHLAAENTQLIHDLVKKLVSLNYKVNRREKTRDSGLLFAIKDQNLK